MIETYLYLRPAVGRNTLGSIEVDEALEALHAELGMPAWVELRIAHSSIAVPGCTPDEVWSALDRIVPMWVQRRLFYLPRLGTPDEV